MGEGGGERVTDIMLSCTCTDFLPVNLSVSLSTYIPICQACNISHPPPPLTLALTPTLTHPRHDHNPTLTLTLTRTQIRRHYEMKPFFRNAFITPPTVLQHLAQFMSRAMALARTPPMQARAP